MCSVAECSPIRVNQRIRDADLYIIGAGGHGRELHAYVQDLRRGGWPGKFKGFLDDQLPKGPHGELDVLGPIDSLDVSQSAVDPASYYITAIGSNPVRFQLVARLEEFYGDAFVPWTLIHPSAYIGSCTEIGEGTCIAPGAIVTAGVKIGRHCIVNVKASVSHDCTVGDFVNINPASTVCGWVRIGAGAFIGAGATVKDRVTIGARSIIGAGAVVTKDIPPDVTAVGVPARVIKNHGCQPCK